MKQVAAKFSRICILFILILCGIFTGRAIAAVHVDGILDEAEWAAAQSFPDFVVIDPLTLGSPRLKTEAKLASTPEGLAVAFVCDQPEEDPRTRTVSAPDADSFDSDFVTFIADFDGTGEIGYEFRVAITGSYSDATILSQDRWNFDWDGLWQRAVSENSEAWTVEMLIPWSIASMRDGDGQTRRIGVSFQRNLYASNQTFAYPGEIYNSQHTVSNAAKVDVAQYSSSEFDIWPYVTVIDDLIDDDIEAKVGFDLFWKPTGSFQVSATANPDFGQVESDELVINFSAFETYFSDKRPFFTENQAIFDTSKGQPGRLVYTRRIGSQRDDGRGTSDVDGAVKTIGSAGQVNYGIFAAWESDEVGRSYYAGRLLLPKENWKVGLLSTFTDRPYLERTGMVNAVDYSINPTDSFLWVGQVMRSDIDTPSEETSGYGTWAGLHYDPSKEQGYMLYLTHYDKDLDINDMGFLRRNDYQEFMIRGVWTDTDFSQDSRTAAVSWALMTMLSRNTEGDRFPAVFRLSRTENMRNGAALDLNVSYETDGYDDMFTRGSGIMYVNDRWGGSASFSTQRHGAWRNSIGAEVFQEGIDGWGVGVNGGTTWYPSDILNLGADVTVKWSDDWLNWIEENRVGDYSRRLFSGKLTGNWFPAEKHELRLLAQWAVVDADAIQGYRVGEGGRLVDDDETITDFAALDFGFQVRYRYELAPLSYFYAVYSRGGSDFLDDPDSGTTGLVGDATSLRDSDQICVKLQYRF